MTPQFLIAKFVPDLSRMEPRNIGVFLWAKGDVAARFLDPNDAGFIVDQQAYTQWVEFWQNAISGDEIPQRHGKPIPKANPKCLDALRSTQEGNYLLVDAGELMQPIKKRELANAAQFLFDELVATQAVSTSEKTIGFSKLCDSVVTRSGIAERTDFHRKYRVELPVYGVRRKFRFSYGVGNGQPLAVIQRVVLSKEQSVNSAALMMHEITDDAVVPRAHCAALVQKSDINNETAEEGYDWLQGICDVIDVDGRDSADHLASVVPD